MQILIPEAHGNELLHAVARDAKFSAGTAHGLAGVTQIQDVFGLGRVVTRFGPPPDDLPCLGERMAQDERVDLQQIGNLPGENGTDDGDQSHQQVQRCRRPGLQLPAGPLCTKGTFLHQDFPARGAEWQQADVPDGGIVGSQIQ